MLVTIVRASTPHTATLLKSFSNANGVPTIFDAVLDFENYFDSHFDIMSEVLKNVSTYLFIINQIVRQVN
jgi:NAD/NADP transhydrogenase alpha subunit